MSSLSKLSDFVLRRRARRAQSTISDLPITTGAEGHLVVPICKEPSPEQEEIQFHAIGQRLARQDDWYKLAVLIEKADASASRASTGTAVSELLGFGARADVIGAFEHMLAESDDPDAPLWDGINALDDIAASLPEHYGIAALVALAHIDIAWLWRGELPEAKVPSEKQNAFKQHMNAARNLLDQHCAGVDHSPLVALARALSHTRPDLVGMHGLDQIAQAHFDLFAANPNAKQHMRAFGQYLLPRRFGTYTQLESEARRASALLSQHWGAGAYTWITMDAVSNDVEALAGLDVDYFIEGLRDILDRNPDQYTVNLLAAYCSVTMSEDSGNDAADFNRARIRACRNWIICDYLHELHPLVWAHAMRGFDKSVRVRCMERFANRGLTEARRVLKALFLPELARGQNVSFTPDGPVTELPRRMPV